MNKSGKLLLLLAAFVILIGGAAILYDQLQDKEPTGQLVSLKDNFPTSTKPAATQQETQGETTPETTEAIPDSAKAFDFTAYDAQGNAVRLSDYFGKPIVLNFWASWCGPCQSEMPDFQKKYEQLGKDVQFLMVNMTDGRETVETAKAFIDRSGYTFPVLFDTDAQAAIAYSVYSLPTTYFIDAQGIPVAYATGAIDEALLQQGIDMMK